MVHQLHLVCITGTGLYYYLLFCRNNEANLVTDCTDQNLKKTKEELAGMFDRFKVIFGLKCSRHLLALKQPVLSIRPEMIIGNSMPASDQHLLTFIF